MRLAAEGLCPKLYNRTMQNKNQMSRSARRANQGAKVPMSVIRRYARQIAEQFQPDKIYLFGSHA
jgi:hypothetical protein